MIYSTVRGIRIACALETDGEEFGPVARYKTGGTMKSEKGSAYSVNTLLIIIIVSARSILSSRSAPDFRSFYTDRTFL